MMNKIIFMTGATSGFGQLIAKKCALLDYTVVITARSEEKAKRLVSNFREQHPEASGKIEYLIADLNDLTSVAQACSAFRKKYTHVDIIINNAGIMNFEHLKSKDGIEQTLQVNLLAPMLITHLLVDIMPNTGESKILNTSSGLHQGVIQFDNIEFTKSFSSFKSYRQSKLGVILMGRLLAPLLKEQNIGIYSIHPGMINTNLGRSAGWFSKLIFRWMGKPLEHGTHTHMHLIKERNQNLTNGEYYADQAVKKITNESYDLDMANKLRDVVRDYLSPFIGEGSIILPK